MKSNNIRKENFVEKIAYKIDVEKLYAIELRISPSSKNNLSVISVRDILNKITEADNKFEYEDKSFSYSIIFGDEKIDIIHDTTIFIDILKLFFSTKDLNKTLHCSWYYYNDDAYVIGDASSGVFKHYYLTYEMNIINEKVSLLESRANEFLIIDDPEEFFSTEREDRVAIARILFNKWIYETKTGNIYSEKIKIFRDRFFVANETERFLFNILSRLNLIHRISAYILIALICILIILIYHWR